MLSADSDSTATRPRPRRRSDVSAVYDRKFDRLVVSCGEISAGHIGDTWAFYLQTNQWVRLRNSNGPCPREGSAAIIGIGSTTFFLFGGFGIWDNGDYYTFNLADSTWSGNQQPGNCKDSDCGPLPCTAWNSQPGPRWYHKMIWDPVNNRTVLISGYYSSTALTYGDAWSFNGSSWSTLANVPSAGLNSAFVYDSRRRRAILFGGSDDNEYTLGSNGSYALSLASGGTPAWTTLSPAGTPPPEIQFQAGVYDSVNDRMVVFGGLHGVSPDPDPGTDTIYGDTWELAFADAPPQAVSDLDAEGDQAGPTIIGLNWTVPTDSVDICSYLYAASTDSITDANFDSNLRDRVPYALGGQLWPPGLGHGTSQSELIGVPGYGHYYVGMRTVSLAGIRSAISNVSETDVANNPLRGADLQSVGAGVTMAPKLWPASPNPARASQSFRLDLPAGPVAVTFTITNLSGRRVRNLVTESSRSGTQTLEWNLRDDDGRRVAPGMYFAQVRAGGLHFKQSVIVLN